MSNVLKVLATGGLLAATGLVIILHGPTMAAAVLAVAGLTALWWWFIRASARREKSSGHPVSCCHYLGDPTGDEHDQR